MQGGGDGRLAAVGGDDGGFANTKAVAGTAAGNNSVAVFGQTTDPSAFAGFFRGKVTIQGGLLVSRIDAQQVVAAKGMIGGAKLFRIDHPLDAGNKFLNHASIESSEFKNLYDGVATLDDRGTARVRLPEWFEALNGDFRYQLTPIGRHAPLYIARELLNGTFEIAGGTPNLRVSWQVTGIRKDPYAKAHPLVVEEPKALSERGKYVNPVELGLPESLGIGHSMNQHVASLGTRSRDRTR
jgi:hypothetical protein